MEQKIDIQQVKKIQKLLAADRKVGGAVVEEKKQYLFFYTKYNFIEKIGDTPAKGYETLSESQAEAKLNAYPDMTVTVLRLINSPVKMPAILKNRKGVETAEVGGHSGASDYIFNKTGVRVKETDV
ncbi:MAG TPA: hypothetical protein VMT63_05750 [Bacteroidales bacterium]|nr:hypothetical protein [Bacteroidales bacterium]